MKYVNSEAINWAFACVVLNTADKLVLLAIAKGANKHWASFPGRAEISRMTGIAEASIVKCIRRLERAGHLKRVPFAANNGQDQKVGYVLAGCGRPLDTLDTEFLDLAFAERKQPGAPLTAKPQHWSGAKRGEGGCAATLPGWPASHPQGGPTATPRRKEKKEERREQEEGAIAQAPNKFEAPSTPAAIAEVRAAAPTPKSGSTTETVRIPKQRRESYPSNQKRDNDWRAQIVAADLDELDGILDACGHGAAAYRLSAFRLGLGAGEQVPDELYPQYVRHAYLYLLKDVAATDPGHLDEFLYPLDGSITAGSAPYKWDHTEHVPAGETAESFTARMLRMAASMPPEQLGPWAAQIEDFLPGLWYEKRYEARAFVQAQGLPLEIETIASKAVRLMIQYYADKPHPKWPAEVVPPSMRTVASITESPSWAA